MNSKNICINVGMNSPVPEIEQIETIKNAGFDGVFFDWKRNVDRSAEIRKALSLGLELQSLHAPFYGMDDIFHADDALSDKMINDIIGTIASNKSTKNYIITGDKDSLQLINENTEVWLTRKGISEIEKFDIAHFNEVYGLEPEKMVDIKALMGDSSDNIPGVKGIGEKTALNLLKEYNSVENLYNNIENIKGKVQEKLINDKEMCFLSKTLATINREVPIKIDFNETNLSFPFEKEVAAFFNKA